MVNMQNKLRAHSTLLVCMALMLVAACVLQDTRSAASHRWWSGLGPVVPHESFPANCNLCHVGEKWHVLTNDFQFDHEKETGVALVGAHARAKCLRCHNDRGPVADFQSKGCAGCHEDIHSGDLGKDCRECHGQMTWRPEKMIERHNRGRLPLVGAHLAAACHRCHPGGFVGNFRPVSAKCVNCHAADVANTTNPPHIPLGWVNRCDRCHMPTRWNQAQIK